MHGLEDTEYLDKLDDFSRKRQQGAITIDGGVDRVYVNTKSDCIIEDPGMKRRIVIRKLGSRSTVVWNPWRETAERMGDLGPDGYRKMLCVESGNAADNTVRLNAGESHGLEVSFRVIAD